MKKPKRKPLRTWRAGDKIKLARLAGISPQNLSNYLAGRCPCPPPRAEKLEAAAEILGYDLPAVEWVFHKLRRGNPLFAVQKRKPRGGA
jgi:DNA-binding transcriptional regulator YdaS (Cro superfamily)